MSGGAESFAVILKDVVCLSVKSHTAAGPIQNYVLVFGPIRVFNRANFAKIAGGKV